MSSSLLLALVVWSVAIYENEKEKTSQKCICSWAELVLTFWTEQLRQATVWIKLCSDCLEYLRFSLCEPFPSYLR